MNISIFFFTPNGTKHKAVSRQRLSHLLTVSLNKQINTRAVHYLLFVSTERPKAHLRSNKFNRTDTIEILEVPRSSPDRRVATVRYIAVFLNISRQTPRFYFKTACDKFPHYFWLITTIICQAPTLRNKPNHQPTVQRQNTTTNSRKLLPLMQNFVIFTQQIIQGLRKRWTGFETAIT